MLTGFVSLFHGVSLCRRKQIHQTISDRASRRWSEMTSKTKQGFQKTISNRLDVSETISRVWLFFFETKQGLE
jgi:hypothetical protein